MSIRDKHIIIKEKVLSTVTTPLKSTQRIRYTCFDVSQNFLIFGATSGGIYIFQRDPCNFLQLVPSKEGAISKVCLSKDEKFIAFSTVRGVACAYEWNLADKAKLLNKSGEHGGCSITELVWSDSGCQLYIGDNLGRLSVMNISLFMNRSIFHLPAVIFMQLESAIVQVSYHESYLLVSTENWCYICDTQKEQYRQIGSKPREGIYGACFFKTSVDLKILCARPGARLWEVTTAGIVTSTHQFKRALASPPVEVVLLEENRVEIPKEGYWPDQAFNFCYLTPIMDRYLLTFKEDGVYLFDPINVRVVLWTNQIKNILSAKCINYTIYIWTSRGELQSLTINTLDKCLVSLYFQEEYKLCCDLCDIFMDNISIPHDYSLLSPLSGLLWQMETFHLKNDRVHKLITDLSKHVGGKLDYLASKLDSGIFLVENRHWKKWKVINNNDVNPGKDSCKLRSASVPLGPSRNGSVDESERPHLSLSMPNLELSMESQNIYVNESCTSDDDISGLVDDSSMSEYSVPPSPFLLNTSDVYQNSFMKISQGILEKALNGTIPLDCNWEKSASDSSGNKSNVINGYRRSTSGNVAVSHVQNSGLIIDKNKENKEKTVFLDCSDVIKICGELESANSSDLSVSFKLFNCILNKARKLNEVLGIYGDVKSPQDVSGFPFSQYVPNVCFSVIKRAFHGAISSGRISEYLNEVDPIFFEGFDSPPHPSLLLDIFSTEDLLIDLRLRNLMTIFSEIIDPYSVLQSLEQSQLPCCYFSWCYILNIFQDNVFDYIPKKDDPGIMSYNEWPLPLLLNTLFLMFRLNQVDSSCLVSDEGHLALFHISYLILKLSTYLTSSGTTQADSDKQCNDLLLKYVSRIIDGDLLKLSDISVSPVREHVERAFLYFNSSDDNICSCGYSRSPENENSLKYPLVGRLLLILYLRCYKSRVDCSENFEVITPTYCDSYMEGYVQSEPLSSFNINGLKPINDLDTETVYSFRKEYLPIVNLIKAMPSLINTLILHTDCDLMECCQFLVQFDLLKNLNEYMFKASEDFLKKLCFLNYKYAKGFCCMCNDMIQPADVNWNELMKLVVKSLGGPKAIKLIEEYAHDIPSSQLDCRFYRACVLSRTLLTNYPEKHSSVMSTYFNVICRESHEILEDSELLYLNNSVSLSSIRRNRWGVKVDLNSNACFHCSLVLNSEPLIQNGVRAFTCGHIFHTICLTHAVSPYKCPSCKGESV